MACNGNNHPPNCMCNFRGGWSGYRTFDPLERLMSGTARPRQLGYQAGTASVLSGGFTKPGARCPVCGDLVYFYQSSYGGRVFFDSLGPPWPKHPCTDNRSKPTFPRLQVSWHLSGWAPISGVTIQRVSEARRTYNITGTSEGRHCSFYFRAEEIVMAEMVRVRREGRGKFRVSILDFNTVADTWCTWDGDCRTTEEEAIGETVLTQTRIWTDSKQEQFAAAHTNSSPVAVERMPLPSDWRTCNICNTRVLVKNYSRHVKRIHDA